MNIKQALEKSQYCNDKPIVRKCSSCPTYLDEKSQVIADTRPKIDFLVSHGYCPTCLEKAMEEIRQSKLLNNL